MSTLEDYSLDDRYRSERGSVVLTGAQALVRVPLDQVRADARAGLETAALVCGYRGSPLGGIDSNYWRNSTYLDAQRVRFINGVNEELAATAVWGSQQASRSPAPLHDGVIALWYGKGPGIDRAGDAIRHGNFAGSGRTDGVLVVVGDDPACKSSTIPSASEHAMADLALPTLYPASVQEVLDFGLVGYAMSRASGAWVGVKIHTDVADGSAAVDVSPDRRSVVSGDYLVDGEPFRQTCNDTLLAPVSVDLEHEALTVRPLVAQHIAALNGLDRVVGAERATIGIVAAGKPYLDLRSALDQLGVGTEQLEALGIRLYKPAVIWPLAADAVREFARDLDVVCVVEEKRPFLEEQVRSALYDAEHRPAVVGKRDEAGAPLVPSFGALEADLLVEPLRRFLGGRLPADALRRPRERIPVVAGGDALPARTPFFCSGCPHNTSTRVPEGSTAGGGIGCHGMALNMDRAVGITQMGGEGVTWAGLEPFVDEGHRFQNLGDGTFAHSGLLAVRQTVSAGTNVTFKILYNDTVAMTGGQTGAGQLPVPELTRELEAEGVRRIAVVTDDPDKYPKSARFAEGCTVVDRSRFDEVQLELREVPGVTALVYDQGCAAELRRNRKRGRVDTPTTRVIINEAVCDGCGHCGVVSNCVSVRPVETPFGRKTRIHQESCNYDMSCLGGECPAFLTVEIDPDDEVTSSTTSWRDLLERPAPPAPTSADTGTVLTVGIGGTGVVTVNQLLTTAALLDGKAANSLDQTGLAQKGGQVVSHLRIGPGADEGSNRLGAGDVDAYLVFDLMAGTNPANLGRVSPERTAMVVSTSRIPTGAMVTDRELEEFPDVERFRDRLAAHADDSRSHWLDAEGIARDVFGSQPAANLLVVGVAYQLGLLPVSAEALDRAIELNDVAVEMNRAAFHLGRLLGDDPSLADGLRTADTAPSPAPLEPSLAALAGSIDADERDADQRLADAVRLRLPELAAWGDRAWAERYADAIRTVRARELAVAPGRSDLSVIAAHQLAKLMTYKDEYEVARLHGRGEVLDGIRRDFGPNARVSFQLKPPTMSRLGIDRKIGIDERAATKLWAALERTKRLRGSRLDPFGRTEERRLERALIEEYRDVLDELAGGLTADRYDEAVRIAGLADEVRGFGHVKLANIERYRVALAEALDRWRAG